MENRICINLFMEMFLWINQFYDIAIKLFSYKDIGKLWRLYILWFPINFIHLAIMDILNPAFGRKLKKNHMVVFYCSSLIPNSNPWECLSHKIANVKNKLGFNDILHLWIVTYKHKVRRLDSLETVFFFQLLCHVWFFNSLEWYLCLSFRQW